MITVVFFGGAQDGLELELSDDHPPMAYRFAEPCDLIATYTFENAEPVMVPLRTLEYRPIWTVWGFPSRDDAGRYRYGNPRVYA